MSFSAARQPVDRPRVWLCCCIWPSNVSTPPKPAQPSTAHARASNNFVLRLFRVHTSQPLLLNSSFSTPPFNHLFSFYINLLPGLYHSLAIASINMGKLGRFACIFVPMLLSIGSLVCLLVIFAAGLAKNNSTLQDLYYFRVSDSSIRV